jgi:hypothetical protein
MGVLIPAMPDHVVPYTLLELLSTSWKKNPPQDSSSHRGWVDIAQEGKDLHTYPRASGSWAWLRVPQPTSMLKLQSPVGDRPGEGSRQVVGPPPTSILQMQVARPHCGPPAAHPPPAEPPVLLHTVPVTLGCTDVARATPPWPRANHITCSWRPSSLSGDSPKHPPLLIASSSLSRNSSCTAPIGALQPQTISLISGFSEGT